MLHCAASRVQKGENLQQTVQFGSAAGPRPRSRRIFYSLAKEPRRRSIRVTFRISVINVQQSSYHNNVRTQDLLSLITNLSPHRHNSSPRLGLAEAFFVDRREPRPAPRVVSLLCLYPSLFSACHTDTVVVKNGSAASRLSKYLIFDMRIVPGGTQII
jgi:hypothetical protein